MQASRCYFSIVLVFLSSMFFYGQNTIRKKINIDDNWKFHFGHAVNPEKDFNYGIATIFLKSGGAAKTAIDVY